MLDIKITDPVLYGKTIDEVKLPSKQSVKDNVFNGKLTLILQNGTQIKSDGQHHADSFKNFYGFEVVNKKSKKK